MLKDRINSGITKTWEKGTTASYVFLLEKAKEAFVKNGISSVNDIDVPNFKNFRMKYIIYCVYTPHLFNGTKG